LTASAYARCARLPFANGDTCSSTMRRWRSNAGHCGTRGQALGFADIEGEETDED
jgi:hypothetical protein